MTARAPHSAAALPDESVALLRALSGPHGIHASLSDTANYRAVFARDAVMAGVAGLLLGDAEIVGGLVRTLDGLRALQGPEGQIASNYEPRLGGAPHVSFGTLAPRIDAATWYVVGVALAARAGALDAAAFHDSVRRVARLLDALEYNGRDLVYVPTGGNWADEYIYEGYILYDQILRAWGLRLAGALYGEPSWTEKAARIARTLDERFWSDRDPGAAPRAYPLAGYTPVRRFEMFDLAATSLLAVSQLSPARAATALGWVAEEFLDRSALPPAFHPVIDEGDPDWPALRRYHLHEFRNRPHEYHNGGIWPIWLGWLALGLDQAGRAADLERLRAITHTQLAMSADFAFEEYLHGRTGAPGGTRQMAYTATGLVFLREAGSPAARRLLAP